MERAYWKVPTRRWLLATRASTAPGSTASRRTGRPVATTASERVVGMPRACIASLTTYSRSIGPTAAKPSPPRENGVRPEPLRWRSRVPSRGQLAQQQRAAVAEAGGVAAELVAGVGLGDRRRPLRDDRAGEEADALVGAQPGRVEAEVGRQRLVDHEQPRLRRLRGLPRQGEVGELGGVAGAERRRSVDREPWFTPSRIRASTAGRSPRWRIDGQLRASPAGIPARRPASSSLVARLGDGDAPLARRGCRSRRPPARPA